MNLSLIPQDIYKLTRELKKLNQAAKVFLVGGAVRDLLLKRPTQDFDLVVTNITSGKLEYFLKKRGKVVLVGKKFGVFKFIPRGWLKEPIDIALPRLDHSLGSGRYQDFKIKTSHKLPIEEDLTRRDFTINALALDLTTKKIIDVTGGQKDLTKKIIKTVGRPALRFKEDYSRLLRALRLSLQLNFAIETNTWKTIKQMAGVALTAQDNNGYILPREIIARELIKSLKYHPAEAVILWNKAQIITKILPEIDKLHKTPQAKKFHSEGNVFNHTILALKSFDSQEWKKFFPQTKPTISVILATLLHDIGKPLTLQTPQSHRAKIIRTPEHDIKGAALVPTIIERLKLTSYVDESKDKADAKLIEWLVAKHMLLVHGRIEEFRPGTIYRYFYANLIWGQSLQQVILADSLATKPADGRILIDKLQLLRRRIKSLQPLLNKRGKLELLLDGNQIMKKLHLPPGPKIGQLLKILTEAQLTKKITNQSEALTYLKKHL